MRKEKQMIEQLEQDKRILENRLSGMLIMCNLKDKELEKLRISLNEASAEFNEKYAKLLERYIAMMERMAGIDEQREAD